MSIVHERSRRGNVSLLYRIKINEIVRVFLQEEGDETGLTNSFSERIVRLRFIRKVYGILTVQVGHFMFSQLLMIYIHSTSARSDSWIHWNLLHRGSSEIHRWDLRWKESGEFSYILAENWWLWIMAVVILFVVIIGLACCQGLRRQTPYNFILLGVFTLAQSFVLGTITSFYQVNEVIS